jgi:osmoprotectant transport system permease protein
MNLFEQAIAWIFSPDRLGDNSPLPELIAQHLYFTLISVAVAALIAIPVGYYIGHTGRGRNFAIGISGAARAVPSFGLILLLVIVMGVTAKTEAAIIAFVLLAIPSILAGAYAGIESIDPVVIDAARASGMTEWQILWKVEIPLGSLLLLGGVRAAVLQVVATVVLAAYIGLGSLGLPILQGLALRRFDEMLGAALVIMALAIALDLLLAFAQRVLVPRGVISARSSR